MEEADAIVVGGGVSGLSTACRLKRLLPHARLLVIESSDRYGGLVRTTVEDGFLFEHGPDSIYAVGPEVREFLRELDLECELLFPNADCGPTRLLWRGELVDLPADGTLASPGSLRAWVRSPLFTWRGKLRMALEPWVPARRSDTDESVASFAKRRLGSEAANRLVAPLAEGIYGDDPALLSLAASLPHLALYERRNGSILRGARKRRGTEASSFLTLKGGLGGWTERMVRSLPERVCRTACRADSLERDRDGWRLALSGGGVLRSRTVCLATPAPAAARLMAGTAPDLARDLADIPHRSSISIYLAYRREQFRRLPEGKGFLVPSGAGMFLSACSYCSEKFAGRAPADRLLLRASVRRERVEGAIEEEDRNLMATVHAELAPVLGISGQPALGKVFRNRRILPSYRLGHLDRVHRIERRLADLPGLALAGNAYRGAGLSACVASGFSAAEQMAKHLGAVPDPVLRTGMRIL